MRPPRSRFFQPCDDAREYSICGRYAQGLRKHLGVPVVQGAALLIYQLFEPDRRRLLLRKAQHTPYAEIGRVLGVAIGTVKSRIARARERLRATVNAENGNDFATLEKAS